MKQILKRIVYCCALTGLLTGPVFAQKQGQERLDSLVNELPAANEDSNKVILINAISYTCYNIDPDQGIMYGTMGLDLAQKIKWKPGEAMANNNLGVNYKAQSNYAAALNCYLKALAINEQLGNKRGVASNLANIGITYQNRNDYPKALENLQRAMKINEELGNKKGLANNLENLSTVYDLLKNDSLALEYLMRALQINRELGNENDIAANLGNIGTYYSSQNKFGQALEFNFAALRMHDKSGSKNGKTVNLGNIGEIYFAIACRPDGTVKPDSLISPNRRVNLQKAILYLNNAIAASRETGFLKGVIKFSKTLSKAYSLSGDYKNALLAFQQYANVHDSVFSSQNSRQIKAIENQHDKTLKDRDIQIAKLDIQRKTNRNIFYISGIALLLIVIYFIIRERKKTELLLLNILPVTIATRLKNKEHPIADHFVNVSIMFIDMAGFTEFAEARHPKETVSVLNDVFTHFDALAEKHGLEKIKTIGDCYMAVSGVPVPKTKHALQAAAMALEIRETMKGYTTKDGTSIHFRIGLDCGPVVAGVIGKKKFIYDLWGDAVNTASRMEMTGIAGEIHCTDNFKIEVETLNKESDLTITFVNRGMVEVRSKGQMQTWLIK